jgi:hypothetical protein
MNCDGNEYSKAVNLVKANCQKRRGTVFRFAIFWHEFDHRSLTFRAVVYCLVLNP